MSNEIGERVKSRIEQIGDGVTHTMIADRIGLPKDAFSRSLNGSRNFSALELSKLAEALGSSIHWFVTGERDPFELKMSARHSFDHGSGQYEQHDWELAREVTADPALAYRQVDLTPVYHSPLNPSATATQAAVQARSALTEAAGERFVEDLPAAIEEAFGIDVFVLKHEVEFLAYSAEVKGNPFIVVKQSGQWYRTGFSVAHELGHILHGDLSYGDSLEGISASEPWANAFAAQLLMPRSSVDTFDWQGGGARNLAELVSRLGVSTDALRRRLNTLGVAVSPELQRELEAPTVRLLDRNLPVFAPRGNSQMYRKARFPERLVAAHSDALESGKVNGRVLAWILDIPFEDLRPDWGAPPPLDVDSLASELGLTGETRSAWQ